MSILADNGFINSTSEPFANAILVENSAVSWLGSDDIAESMVKATTSEEVERFDLDGALVTAPFIDGFTTTAVSAEEDPRVFATVVGEQPHDEHHICYREDADSATVFISADKLSSLDDVLGKISAPTQLLIQTTSANDLQDALAALAHCEPNDLMRCRHRLLVNHHIADESISTIKELMCSVTVLPELTENKPVINTPVNALLSAGVQVVAGTGDYRGSLWDVVTAMVEHSDTSQRISTRAAFNTVTRDGMRVLPAHWAQENMNTGRLVPGAPASLNIWSAHELGVQAPDIAAAHWSTDARAGTPLLPILSSAESSPQLVAVIRHGAVHIPGSPSAHA